MCSMWYFILSNGQPSSDIYPLSLHDALPIWGVVVTKAARPGHTVGGLPQARGASLYRDPRARLTPWVACCRRSEEHTSELQSLTNLVCRLLLEKKKRRHQASNDSTSQSVTKR